MPEWARRPWIKLEEAPSCQQSRPIPATGKEVTPQSVAELVPKPQFSEGGGILT